MASDSRSGKPWSTDPLPTAAFYRSVFGWTVDTNRPDPSFEDGTGHVIVHFIADQTVAGEAGVRPYIHVERVDDSAHVRGGKVARLVLYFDRERALADLGLASQPGSQHS